MSDPGKAVFLSYASQDAAAVRRIAEALRDAGVEVWFDQNELVGGDAWDAKIRKQIAECALFVPVISAATQARLEGYFRLEWKLAARRTHAMATAKAFLLPVVIDDTRDAEAHVPDEFREVQWTRLAGGETPAKFCTRVKALLGGASEPIRATGSAAASAAGAAARRTSDTARARWFWPAIGGALAVIALGAWLGLRRPPVGAAEGHAPDAGVGAVAPRPMSPARQLAEKARTLIDEIDSTPDDFATAEGLVKSALEQDQNDGEIWAISSRLNSLYMTRAFDTTGARAEPARSQAERALKLAPDSVETLLAVARVNRRGDDERAEAALRKALTIAPKDGRVLLNLGSLYRVRNRLDEALALYEQAAAVPEVMPLARYDQFLVTFYQRKFAEAERYVREAATALPTTNFVTGHAMVELTWRGRADEALRVLAAAPARVRSEPRSVIVTVMAALMNRQPEIAVTALRGFPADYINDAWYTGPKALLTGICEAQAGRPEAARLAWESGIALLRKRMQDRPNGFDENLRLGELLAWSGDQEGALRQVKIAEQLVRGRSPDWAFSPARIYAALGRAEEAVAFLAAELNAPPSSRWPLTPALLRLDPIWDKLRGDARFEALLAEPKPAEKLSAVAPAPEAKSIAVLAFDNRSDDREAEYFAEGISDELINALGRVPGLTVRGRTSAFFFKGRNTTAREIGEQLGVAYLLRGSVRKAGGRVRISAQLSRAATDEVVWTSEPMERELKEVFAVQDEIVGVIAKNLSLNLGLAGRPARAVQPEALNALLEGRHFWVWRTNEGFARARALFERAVALDPDWAPAHAAMANLLTIEASFRLGGGEVAEGRFAAAARHAQRAIFLDAALGEPHAALAKIAMEEGRRTEAGERFRRALALEPNNAMVHDWQGDLMMTEGRLDAAHAGYRRALELDPLAPYIQWDLAWSLLHLRRHAEALALVERAISLTPSGSARLSLRRARLLLELGRRSEAEAIFRGAFAALESDDDRQFANEAVWGLAVLGPHPERDRWAAELLRRNPDGFASGVIWLLRGELERGMELLEKTPTIFRGQLYWDPVFDSVRDTPRFDRLMAKLGCTEEYRVARATLARLVQESGAKR